MKSIDIKSITESKIKKSKSISELDQFHSILNSRIQNGNKYWIIFINTFLFLGFSSMVVFLITMGLIIEDTPESNGNLRIASLSLCLLMSIFFTVMGFITIRNTLKLGLEDNRLLKMRKRLLFLVEQKISTLNNQVIFELSSLSSTSKKFLKEKGINI